MKRVNATDIVVDYVKESVRTGKLHAGDKLPKEGNLAMSLGVGRSSLREGIKILAAYGIVESRQGEGTFIVDRSAENFSEFLGFFSSMNNLMNFLELRRVLEIGNIITIYDKVTPKDIVTLEGFVRVFDEAHPESDYVEADKQFHSYLLGLTHNPMIIQINNMIMKMREDLLWKIFVHPEIVNDARVAHREILNALKSRNREASIEAVAHHLDTTVRRVPIVYGKN